MRKFTQSWPMAVTDEEGDLLYALTRMRKPLCAVETGTATGVSSRRIGQAILENRIGLLYTCELDDDCIVRARERTAGLPVEIHKMPGVELIAAHAEIDLAFIDSGEPAVRVAELKLLVPPRVTPGGIVVVHDVLNNDEPDKWDYSVLMKEMDARGWPKLVLPSLVGIAIYRRPA